MENSLPLDSLLHEYHKGMLNKKKLEGSIFDYLLKNSAIFRLNSWSKDEYVDFLCWLYSRISRAIDKYQDTGSSFDAYIYTMAKWASMEYIRIEAAHRITEQCYWETYTRDMAVCEQGRSYCGDAAPFKRVTNPRQALILLLKSYYFISEDFINKAAPAIGMKKEKLNYLIEQMRNLRFLHDEAYKKFQDNIHTLYYRCINLEKRMNIFTKNSAKYKILEIKLDRARKHLSSMRRRFKQIRINPSNKQIAQILGLPKGTVDSNLFALKAKFNPASKQKLAF
jgi:exonuclease VII small subunit